MSRTASTGQYPLSFQALGMLSGSVGSRSGTLSHFSALNPVQVMSMVNESDNLKRHVRSYVATKSDGTNVNLPMVWKEPTDANLKRIVCAVSLCNN